MSESPITAEMLREEEAELRRFAEKRFGVVLTRDEIKLDASLLKPPAGKAAAEARKGR